MIALGGVPDGKHRAKLRQRTTGVSTAMGDRPFAGPMSLFIIRILDANTI